MTAGESFQFLIVNEHGDVKKDSELFLETDEHIEVIKDGEKDLLDILVITGIFPSKGQARKNGWKPEIPNGFSLFERLGKFKKTISIFKMNHPDYESCVCGRD